MATQRSFLHAVKWAYIANWGERSFSALFTFILAAVLGPRDFGIVSIALIYIGFLQMFLDQGLVAALIQKKIGSRAFRRRVLDGYGVEFSFWWAWLYPSAGGGAARTTHLNSHQLFPFCRCASRSKPSPSFKNSLLSKDMDFKAMSIRSNVSVLISGVVGIVMAFTWIWRLGPRDANKILRGFHSPHPAVETESLASSFPGFSLEAPERPGCIFRFRTSSSGNSQSSRMDKLGSDSIGNFLRARGGRLSTGSRSAWSAPS